MNDFKIISKRISGVLNRIDNLSYFRVNDEENIWVCPETGDLCYFDNIENITKELLLENNIIGSYIISQEKDLICIGKVINIVMDEGNSKLYLYGPWEDPLEESNNPILLSGEFLLLENVYETIDDMRVFSKMSMNENDGWFIGRDYTNELVIISEHDYLEILKHAENDDIYEILPYIDELLFVDNEDEDYVEE